MFIQLLPATDNTDIINIKQNLPLQCHLFLTNGSVNFYHKSLKYSSYDRSVYNKYLISFTHYFIHFILLFDLLDKHSPTGCYIITTGACPSNNPIIYPIIIILLYKASTSRYLIFHVCVHWFG